MVAGVTAEQHGWRSFWWVSTALGCFSLVYQLLFLPETKWIRRQRRATSSLNVLPQKNPGQEQVDVGASEKQAESAIPERMIEDNAQLATAPEDEIVVKLAGKPNKRQFSIWMRYDHEEPFLRTLFLPFKLFVFPIVQWSSFVFSWVASCFLVVNITQSQALAGPPWNLSPANVGYTNFAIFGGASISLLTAGPLSDWISMRSTMRNKGIREPEMRLVAMVPYACCTLIGSLIISYGYQQGWPWEAIVIGGYTLIGIQLTALSAICTTYAVSKPPS